MTPVKNPILIMEWQGNSPVWSMLDQWHERLDYNLPLLGVYHPIVGYLQFKICKAGIAEVQRVLEQGIDYAKSLGVWDK